MNLKNLKPFIIFYGIFLLGGWLPLLLFDKGDILLLINKYSSPKLDNTVLLFTHLGDGKTLALFAIFLAVFVQYRHALAAFISLLLSGIITFVFKRLIFSGVERPRLFFDTDVFYRIIEGRFFLYGSFPSGHTITGFTLILLIAIVYRNKWLSGIVVIFGLLVGLSRIYLLHHFYIDVYFGTVIGVIIPLIAYAIINKWYSSDRFNTCLVKSFKRNSAAINS